MRVRCALVGALLLYNTGAVLAAADSAAAARQYRVARRLAAEGSGQASAALRKVVELDPTGPLADDALIDQALLEVIPHWPEELGLMNISTMQRIKPLLRRAAETVPGADRGVEARYYLALLSLERLPGRDEAAARVDLITAATHDEDSPWPHAARYALAWLDEQQVRIERAGAAYQRVLVDAPDARAAARARLGLARMLLRDGHAGRAAVLLQEAITAGLPASSGAEGLRELAVRSLLAGRGSANMGPPQPVAPSTGIRGLAGLATMPDGGVVMGDRRGGSVFHFTADGGSAARWSLDDLQVATVCPLGRVYAAAGEWIYRLEPGEQPRRVAAQGDLAPLSALAGDAAGNLWLLDKKGERVGRVEPGGSAPTMVSSSSGSRLVSLVWDGRRLIGLHGRDKTLVTIGADGGIAVLGSHRFEKPISLAADPSGRLAVLDTKAGSVIYLRHDGSVSDSFSYRSFGIERPVAIAFGFDGALHLFDESTGAWMRQL